MIRSFVVLGLLYSGVATAQTFDVLHVFDNSTESPTAPVLAASDGNLYLPTYGGGTGLGAVYRLTPDGAGSFTCALIHSFSGNDGAYPAGGLVEGPDGLLYGTTHAGGATDWGVLYRISTSGSFELLRSLTTDDAANPFGELVLASDGKLYGTSAIGGADGNGSLFRFDPAANEMEMLYFFSGLTGANPQSGLLLGSDGRLYGSAPHGGAEDFGTLFRIDTAGNFDFLYSFIATDANRPSGVLAELGGSIYGGAHGDFNKGAIFRWNAVDGLTNVHVFSGLDGAGPTGGLIETGGFLYGATYWGGPDFAGNVFRSDAAGTLTTLHDFDYLDGAVPSAHPTRVGTAWLGTTQTGGSGFAGTVYQIPDGGELATVCPFGQGLGNTPYGALVEASDGNLYGTTMYGGLYYDQGTVFRLGKDGQVSTMHSFNQRDGRYPSGGLVQGSDGALFGVTYAGGAENNGAAFRLELGGDFSLLHSYTYQDETGDYPSALALGPDGEMYAPTTDSGLSGTGTIYRLAVSGAIENLRPMSPSADGPLLTASDGFLYGIQGGSSLFRFSTDGDLTPIGTGAFPLFAINPGLAEGGDHNFYGTTYYGLLFRFLDDGRSSILHTFSTNPVAPVYPSSLVRGSDGRLYGTSHSGMAYDPGTVFRTSIYGDFEVLHTFAADDPQFLSGVIEGSDGNLYGLATRSLAFGRGLAYRIELGTQVNQISPSSGPAFDTAAVQITGALFQDGASVAVGAVPATDVVVSSASQATATVPILFPGTLNDVVVTNPDTSSGTLKNGWLADFLDVPQSDPFHPYVEKAFRNHVAAGYGSGLFGRNDPVTRAQMAVFVIKGGVGPGMVPAACPSLFVDVACPSLFADWILEMAAKQISQGCQQSPPAYCPDAHVTRAQMAVFILKALHGGSYTPPACTGIFEDVACPGAFAADWIEDLYNSGVTGGCSTAPLLYCPDGPVSRGQMAVLIVRAFGLP